MIEYYVLPMFSAFAGIFFGLLWANVDAGNKKIEGIHWKRGTYRTLVEVAVNAFIFYNHNDFNWWIYAVDIFKGVLIMHAFYYAVFSYYKNFLESNPEGVFYLGKEALTDVATRWLWGDAYEIGGIVQRVLFMLVAIWIYTIVPI